MQDRRYPIGPFVSPPTSSPAEIAAYTAIIEQSPDRYRDVVESLSPTDLTKTYRDGSWTVGQLVHHVADIQLLHFFRLKKALTEPDYTPVTLIDMNAWVTTPDSSSTAPLVDSLLMLEGINRRYVRLAKSLDETQLAIQYYHPVRQIWINQAQALAMSAWHVQHHLAHIKLALQ
jgi:hypothetical protein